jgi:hypothetical protein
MHIQTIKIKLTIINKSMAPLLLFLEIIYIIAEDTKEFNLYPAALLSESNKITLG